ncbi:HAD family hydrolase [Micrococcales bacterium 31B]|nr:HAD family hydrolase [Micrococcales bacterium 31B]
MSAPAAHLVALDIDGTILAADGVRPAVREAVRDTAEAGHHVVIATGRGPIATLGICAELGFAGYVVCCNGALTMRVGPGLPPPTYRPDAHGSGYGALLLGETVDYGFEVMSSHWFEPAAAIAFIREALPDVQISIAHLDNVRSGPAVTSLFPPEMLFGSQTLATTDEMGSLKALKLIAYAPSHSLDEIRAMTEQVPEVNAVLGWGHWVDVMRGDVSKALGLEELRVELGVPLSRTVAVGDGPNDMEMLQWAGRGVAMGNAGAALKAVADEVAGDVEHDGLVEVLRAL